MEVLDFIGLAHLAHSKLDGLPYGTLKLIEIGTVLATDPDVILLDEPSSGMGPDEAHDVRREAHRAPQDTEPDRPDDRAPRPLVAASATTSTASTSARSSPKGSLRRSQTHPEVIAAYLGSDDEDEDEDETADTEETADVTS